MQRRFITPEEIRGHAIRHIWNSPGKSFQGYWAARAVVELDSGLRFELRAQHPDDRTPLAAFAESLDGWSKAQLRQSQGFSADQRIADVVTSECWPSIGLLLDSGALIYESPDFGSHAIVLCMTKLGEVYTADEVRPFWA